jgi:hypothetical protein
VTDINKIISDLERQKEAISRAIAALREIGGGGSSTEAPASASAASKAAPRKWHLSPAARKRISEATRQRWAAKRIAKSSGVKKRTAKKTAAKTSSAVVKKTASKKTAKNAKRAARKQTTPAATVATATNE